MEMKKTYKITYVGNKHIGRGEMIIKADTPIIAMEKYNSYFDKIIKEHNDKYGKEKGFSPMEICFISCATDIPVYE